MNIPLLDLKAQYEGIKDEIQAAINEVLESAKFILGPQMKMLEQEIAEFCGTKFGVAVANGTDALFLALKAFGIGEGDEVITSTYTFFASGETVSQVGATPVFVDIDPKTYNLDLEELERKITPKTKALIPVHIFGQMVDMDRVMQIAQKHNLIVIEDACQAIGAKFADHPAGSVGHVGCFSFFPTKNLGAYGDAGMVVTNDPALAEKLTMLRFHGCKKKYYHEEIGFNSRLDEIQAAILRVKLKYLKDWNRARAEKAAIYEDLLKDIDWVQTPASEPQAEHVYHLFIVRVENRDAVLKHLQDNGIGAAVYYPVPLHLQKVYAELGYEQGSLPQAEKAALETLALPIYPELSFEQQKYIVDTLRKFK